MAERPQRFFQICVTFEPREDGGLRVFSEDVPELFLSHRDRDAVLDDVAPALETILTYKLKAPVKVDALWRFGKNEVVAFDDHHAYVAELDAA